MTSQTLGLKTMHTPNKRVKTSLRKKVFALRKEGLTCQTIADLTGLGRSTVARITSEWYQDHVDATGIPRRGHVPKGRRANAKAKPTNQTVETPAAPESPVYTLSVKPEPEKQEAAAPSLAPEVVSYINAIYASQRERVGSPVGNLLIRLGKFFGGHYPV